MPDNPFDSPDVPGPDPAIGQAAQSNVQLGRDALDFSKQQYGDAKKRQDEFDPLAKQVVQQQLRIGDKNEAASDDYLNYMKSTFRPVEQSLANDANNFDTEGKRNELAGKAAADYEQAAAVGDANARRNAATYGINPGDGAFTEQMASNPLNATLGKVGAMNNARTAARAEGRAFKFDVAGLGRGLPGAGATASSLAMNAGTNAANVGVMPSSNARADTSVAMGGYGTAIGANNAAGGLYQGVFDSQMKGYDAQMQAKGGLYQGLGTAAGMGAAAMI